MAEFSITMLVYMKILPDWNATQNWSDIDCVNSIVHVSKNSKRVVKNTYTGLVAMGTHLKSWGVGTETRQINIPRLVVSTAFHWPCPQNRKILTATAMPSDRLAGVRSRTQRSGLWTFWYRTRKQDVAFGKKVLRTVSLANDANVDQLTCLGWMESSFH